MKFSIIHPTARVTDEFANPWHRAAYSAFNTCDNRREVEYIIVVHFTRISDFNLYLADAPIPEFGRATVVINYDRDCLVDQCNAGQLAATGEIQCWNQDDMRYPEHWDTEVLKLIPDTLQLVCVQAATDGARRDLLTLPTIATKRLTDAIGLLSNEYESMYSDDEWSFKARQLGVVIPASHLYFQHLHPVNGTAEVDAIYSQENRAEAYRIGRQAFERRRAAGFPRVPMPGEGENAAPIVFEKSGMELPSRTIALAIPGESHRAEWTQNFWRLFAALCNAGWNIRITPGFSTNVYQARMGITRDILKDAEALGEPDYVLWIDDDNTPSVAAINALIATLDAHLEYDGATGWCWIKTRDDQDRELWMTSCGDWDGNSLKLKPVSLVDLFAQDGCPKFIQWSGFPTLLMRFDAVRKMGWKAFKPILTEDNESGFTGEDISFFACAESLDFVVVPQAEVPHWKFQPLRPDYVVHEGADPVKAAAVEAERTRLNGPRIPVTRRIKDIVAALVGIM
jgi:hypothetical protein